MVKATAMKPGPPKAKKTAPLKAKKTVTLKAKNNTSPKAKKSSAAKFLALNKTDDGRFRQKALQKRQTLQVMQWNVFPVPNYVDVLCVIFISHDDMYYFTWRVLLTHYSYTWH